MKASQLIEELKRKIEDFGDLEVKFGELSEEVKNSKIFDIEDVTIEGFVQVNNVIVIWDK